MEHNQSMGKLITVVEFPPFLAQVGKCIASNERDELIDFLARNPEDGDEIQGTGGIRKLRWCGKGKGKGDQEDLTPEHKLITLAKILKSDKAGFC